MSANNIKIYFKAYCPPKSIETRAKHMRILSIVGMLLAGVLVIASVAAALEVGEQAPDFTLPSTTGEKISLSQFQGKQFVLLEFYGADFSPV
jgi:hypothetical protein